MLFLFLQAMSQRYTDMATRYDIHAAFLWSARQMAVFRGYVLEANIHAVFRQCGLKIAY